MLTELDRQIVQRCLAGEDLAWRDFVDRFVGLVAAVVYQLEESQGLRFSPAVKNALISRIFRRLAGHDFALLRRFPGTSSLAGYLAVVARRIAIRAIKSP